MVEVNLILVELFHTTIITYLHFTCIHSIIMPWFSTHLTLPFIKTPYSWLFHITKIYTSEYIIKNSKNNITINFIILWNYRKFTKWYKHKIHCKSLCFFVLLKTWINYNRIPCFVLKNQNNNWNLWFSITKFRLLPLFPKTVFKNVSIFQNFSPWAIPSLFIMIQNQ